MTNQVDFRQVENPLSANFEKGRVWNDFQIWNIKIIYNKMSQGQDPVQAQNSFLVCVHLNLLVEGNVKQCCVLTCSPSHEAQCRVSCIECHVHAKITKEFWSIPNFQIRDIQPV